MSDEAPADGFLTTLANVFVAPSRAFHSIAARPRWDAPLALAIAIGLAFTAIWLTRADPLEFMRAQMEESGTMDRIPSDQRAQVLQGQARYFSAFAWVGPLFFSPLMCAVLALAFLAVYRFFYAAEIRYAQSFAVVAWTFAAFSVLTTPLVLLVLSLTGEWSVDPQSALHANLAAVLDRETTGKALYSLAGSLDLLTLWAITLLSIGYAAVIGSRPRAASWGIVVPWVLYVLGKAALAAIF